MTCTVSYEWAQQRFSRVGIRLQSSFTPLGHPRRFARVEAAMLNAVPVMANANDFFFIALLSRSSITRLELFRPLSFRSTNSKVTVVAEFFSFRSRFCNFFFPQPLSRLLPSPFPFSPSLSVFCIRNYLSFGNFFRFSVLLRFVLPSRSRRIKFFLLF